MKKLIISIVFFLFISINLFAGWERTYGSTFSDYGYSVEQTTDGGYIITGCWDYGPAEDVYLFKTDSNGNLIWEKTFGTDTIEAGYSVEQTSDGGFIVSGYTRSFGYADQVYLIKTASNGDSLWTKTFGGDWCEWGYSVEQTSDDGYIIVGSLNHDDVYLIKTDSFGDTLWTQTYGESTGDVGYSVCQTSDGGYIVTGICNYQWQTEDGDIYLIKTDSLGDTLWTRIFETTNEDWGRSVKQISDGGFIVAGTWNYNWGAGSGEIILIKINNNGDSIWTKTYGGGDREEGYSVDLTNDGGFIIVGYTESYGAGGKDVYLIKTDSLGNTLWTRTFGGVHHDWGESVKQTADGGYIIAGTTEPSGVFSSVYLIKTDSMGLKVEETIISIPSNFSYSINQISDNMTLQFSLPENSNIEFNIYDAAGRYISTPIKGNYSADVHRVNFQTDKRGVYFFNLKATDFSENGKFIVF